MSGNTSENEEGTDRISSLPSDILCIILSKMPTKDALLTKILSRRWKTLSPFRAFPIHLDLDQKRGFPTSNSLANLVDKLICEMLFDVLSIESVFLRWSGYLDLEQKETDEKIVAWVSEIIRRQVVRLELVTAGMISYDALFLTLNNSATLVELNLWDFSDGSGETYFSFPEEFHLPNLKKLRFGWTCFTDASIDEVIVGCPMLTELFFDMCTFNDILHIKSPFLKLFVISYVHFCKGVTFDTPNLEFILLCSGSASGYGIEDWSGADFESLRCAYIEHGIPHTNEERIALDKLLKICSSLCYSENHIEDKIEFVQLPLFPNITWMSFDQNYCYLVPLIACFISKLPIVDTLIFEGLSYSSSYDDELSIGYADFVSLMPTIPVCLKTYLKKIEFLSFNFEENEMKLVEYFLMNGRVLEEVTLCCNNFKDTSNFSRLLTYPMQ